MYAVEAECVRLHDALVRALFAEPQTFYAALQVMPQFVSTAGLNAESPVTRDLFAQLVGEYANAIPDLHRHLYLFDCRALVSAIQECTKEVSILTGEFYRILNLETFFAGYAPAGDDTRYTSSPITTKLTATLGFIYIRLHSLLDYVTKLAHEAEHLRTDFTSYPKLASANILFGAAKHLAIHGRAGSVFESCDEIDEIETVRNRLIHDGMLDDMPKAYEVWKAGQVTERFVLLPDRTGRSFDSFKARRLFYGGDDKINMRLHILVRSFHKKMAETLRGILA